MNATTTLVITIPTATILLVAMNVLALMDIPEMVFSVQVFQLILYC